MIGAIRIRCEHGADYALIRDHDVQGRPTGDWGGLQVAAQEKLDDDDRHLEWRYPLRCPDCGSDAQASEAQLTRVANYLADSDDFPIGPGTAVKTVHLRVFDKVLSHINEACTNPACRVHA